MPNSGSLTRTSLCTQLLEGIIAGVVASHVLLFKLLSNTVPVSEWLWAPATPLKDSSAPWLNASMRLVSISLGFRRWLISFSFSCVKGTCSSYSPEHPLFEQETLSSPKWWCLSIPPFQNLFYDKINIPFFPLTMEVCHRADWDWKSKLEISLLVGVNPMLSQWRYLKKNINSLADSSTLGLLALLWCCPLLPK